MRPIMGKRFLAVLAAGAVVLAACSSSGATTAPTSAAPSAAASPAASIATAPPASLAISPAASVAASSTGLKATYISTGPIGDNPFLQLIANGLTQAGKDCGVVTSVQESAERVVANVERNFRHVRIAVCVRKSLHNNNANCNHAIVVGKLRGQALVELGT